MLTPMDIHGKKFRPLHWKRKNWWLLPVVLVCNVLFFISELTERVGERLNDYYCDKIKP